ncbi:MAG: hypothetical protein WDN45_08400 [Caulobacteraceae bacterium]
MGPWTPAAPADATARGGWWTVYGDPVLDGLEDQLGSSNNSLASAVARYDQARALAGPGPRRPVPRTRRDRHGPGQPPVRQPPAAVGGAGVNDYDNDQIGLAVNYEIDLWGRLRNLAAAQPRPRPRPAPPI